MGFDENEKKCVIPFGKQTKLALYHLDPSIKFTNHGSYGTTPKFILDRKRELQMAMERCPDRWFRYTSLEKWEESINAMADYLKVNKKQVLLYENVTESMGTVLKWVEFDGCRDAILTTAINYQAVLNAIDHTSKYRMPSNNCVQVFKIDVKFPINSEEDLIKEFEKACHEIIEIKKLRLRLAVVDHIASSSSIVYPIERISKLIRSQAGSDCIIVIDGAHAIGQIHLDLSPAKFHADFYISNLHKWFLAPRSCAFLYCSKPSYLDYRFQPCYISHGYAPNSTNHSVSYNHYQRGTMDKTSQYVVADCINFYENFLGGLDRIREYTDPLLERALAMLEREWGTMRLQVPKSMLPAFMRVIKFPKMDEYDLEKVAEFDWESKIIVPLAKHLLDKYNVVAFVGILNSELICRLSCFVYNEFDDFVALKDAVLDIKNGNRK